MNRQNFLGEGENYNGMFPISANTLNFMQEQTEFVSQLASAFGYNVLLKRATAQRPGLIVLNGELLPLETGTSTGGYYNIYEDKDSITAQGTLFANARVVRVVKRESSQGAVSVDVSDVTDLTGRASEGETIANQFLPKGAIIMWSGSWSNIPKGFKLCNGNNGQPVNGVTIPDLRGRFVVGYNPSDEDYNAIGKIGGEKTHQLTADEMPIHGHAYSDDSFAKGADKLKYYGIDFIEEGGEISVSGSDGRGAGNIYMTSRSGGGQPFKHLPPYYALAFLIKVI